MRKCMRLDKFLAEAGVGSRSDVKKAVAKGRVSVNGAVCTDPAVKVDETSDEICCDGQRIIYEKFVYFMLNKPQGIISESRRSSAARVITCIDLIHEETHRGLFPVGRLDKDTEGLLLITDDGQLAHELLSPGKHVDKVYYVELETALSQTDKANVEAGVDIGDERPTLPARIDMITDNSLNITIHEGRFHQIKRMFEAVDNKVTHLKRLRMGSLELDETLKAGEYRRLTPEELEALSTR